MRTLSLVLGLILMTACGTPTGPVVSEMAYALESVGHQALPVTYKGDVVVAGSLILRSDSTFTDHMTYGNRTSVQSGTYSRVGWYVTFTTSDGESRLMVMRSETLEYDVSVAEGHHTSIMVYRRK